MSPWAPARVAPGAAWQHPVTAEKAGAGLEAPDGGVRTFISADAYAYEWEGKPLGLVDVPAFSEFKH